MAPKQAFAEFVCACLADDVDGGVCGRLTLLGDGSAVFQTGITDISLLHAGMARQPPGDSRGVFIALANPYPDVFAGTVRLEQRNFGDAEIVR